MDSPPTFSSLSLHSSSSLDDTDDLLANESLSLESMGGDDSFDYIGDEQPSVSTGREGDDSTVKEREESYVYGGSMGVGLTPAATTTSTSTSTNPTTTSSDTLYSSQSLPSAATPHPVTSSYPQDSEDFTGFTEEEVTRLLELREERNGLRGINEAFEGVLRDLKGVEGKLERFEETIATSHKLLNLYISLNSQAEHTQQLLLNGRWEGVSADILLLAQQESEALARQQALEEEEIKRKEAEIRQIEEEEERKKLEMAKKASTTTTRGRGRGLSSSSRAPLASSSTSTRPTPSTRGLSSSLPPTTGTRGSGIARGSVTGVRGVRGLRSRVLVRGGTGAGVGRGAADS